MHLRVNGYEIRPLSAPDVAYRSDPAIAQYQSWDADYSEADALRLLAAQADRDFPAPGGWMQYAVHDRAGTLLGDVAVHVLDDQPDTYEFGVTMSVAARGAGVATAAIRALIDHLMSERVAHRVFATNDVRNGAVRRLFARLGLRHEGTAVDADWFKGEWTTVETWAVLRREWLEAREAGQETGASRSSSS